MGVRDFVVLNEGTKEDFDMNIFLCPKSEDDDKLANSDKETQSKLASEGNAKIWKNFTLHLG